MCNIDRKLEQQLLAMGLNLIGQAIEANLREQNHSSTDVLQTATSAYSQGKITKSQFMAVINALDEHTYQTRAYSSPTTNDEYLDAHKYLNQYRR
jgi:hypothetical protein